MDIELDSGRAKFHSAPKRGEGVLGEFDRRVSRTIIQQERFIGGYVAMAPRFSEPLFVISVAARLVEMHPQTLRKYEREGLIAPSRTSGNLRLYSDHDIEQLRQVKYLVEERGLNLAGVQLALELTRKLQAMRAATTKSATNSQREELATDLEVALRMLGFVDQERIRAMSQPSQ
jgi:MerR family transcriptional regulator/heat shock protein HspR